MGQHEGRFHPRFHWCPPRPTVVPRRFRCPRAARSSTSFVALPHARREDVAPRRPHARQTGLLCRFAVRTAFEPPAFQKQARDARAAVRLADIPSEDLRQDEVLPIFVFGAKEPRAIHDARAVARRHGLEPTGPVRLEERADLRAYRSLFSVAGPAEALQPRREAAPSPLARLTVRPASQAVVRSPTRRPPRPARTAAPHAAPALPRLPGPLR